MILQIVVVSFVLCLSIVSGETLCSPNDELICGKNTKTCIPNKFSVSNVTCICKENYFGSFCQFSLLYQSCYEIYQFTKPYEPGFYQIDPDGIGPIEATWVNCDKNGSIIIAHNMPQEFLVRDINDTTDKYYEINYNYFSSDAQLKMVLDSTEKCEQTMRILCNNSALEFNRNLTWFESVKFPGIRLRGNDKGIWDCDWCKSNCDSLENTYDYEKFEDSVGIKSIYLVKNSYLSEESFTKISLSNIKCEGRAKPEKIPFLTTSSSLSYKNNATFKGLSFEFQTYMKDIENIITLSNFDESFSLSLKDEYDVILTHVNNNTVTSIYVVKSTYWLNDLNWHKFVFEMLNDEIRLSVDNFFITFPNANGNNNPDLFQNLVFGQNEHNPGFAGDIQNIKINGKNIPFAKFDKNGDFDDSYIWNRYYRKLEHSYAYIYEKEFSQITLKGKIFNIYHNNSYKIEPYNNLIFAIKTNQKMALLFYTHDESNNLLQIHLADEHRIILSVSNYSRKGQATISRCTVFSPQNQTYNDLQWHNIELNQDRRGINLLVDHNRCVIRAPIKNALKSIRITNFGQDVDAIVLPPIHKVSTDPDGFNFSQTVFFGGARAISNEYENFEYKTYLPAFLGCMKLPIPLIDDNWDNEFIKTRCERCENNCSNSGHCFERFNDASGNDSQISCDCSGTSYDGETCSKDVGISFDGSNMLIFYPQETTLFNSITNSSSQSFQFSFSPTPDIYEHEQHLATIIFKHRKQIQIILSPQNQIFVIFQQHYQQKQILTFLSDYKNVFQNGGRHFFKISFNKHGPIWVQIDKQYQYFHERVDLKINDVVKYVFGGKDQTNSHVHGDKHYYFGCMSNAIIDFYLNEKTKFNLFELYSNKFNELSGNFISAPNKSYSFKEIECPGFKTNIWSEHPPPLNSTINSFIFESGYVYVPESKFWTYVGWTAAIIFGILVLLLCSTLNGSAGYRSV